MPDVAAAGSCGRPAAVAVANMTHTPADTTIDRCSKVIVPVRGQYRVRDVPTQKLRYNQLITVLPSDARSGPAVRSRVHESAEVLIPIGPVIHRYGVRVVSAVRAAKPLRLRVEEALSLARPDVAERRARAGTLETEDHESAEVGVTVAEQFLLRFRHTDPLWLARAECAMAPWSIDRPQHDNLRDQPLCGAQDHVSVLNLIQI